MEKEIRDYYKTCRLWLPKYSNFRIFKFRIFDGTKKEKIIKIPDQIRNIETLRKWLIRLAPSDCYYSVNSFLNPTRVKGAQTKNYILFKSIPFDFDADKPYGKEELDIVRESAISLIKSMRNKFDKEPKYTLFSGFKGFQVIYEFVDLDNLKQINYLKLNGIDPDITTDKYRVIRLPLTVNKSGRLAIFLTEKELKRGIDYILNKSKQIYIPHGDVERVERRKPMTISLPSKVNEEESENYPNRSSSNAIFITNEVRKTKRFIPILKYKYKQSKINPKKEMELLAKKYGLNEWFLIKTEEELYCLSLVAFDKRRLEKILNSTGSYSKYEFKKFGKIFMRISSFKSGEDKPINLGILRFELPTKDFLYSRPHTDFLTYFKFAVNPYNKLIGAKKPRILEVKFR